MAKGNMFQGMARGKVGDVVFSRVKGQQISRVRNRRPANPRTIPQMENRVKFAGAASFYTRNKPFFPFAFNYKKTKESEYNAFVAANVGVSPYYTKEDLSGGYIYPAPFRVTEGPMPIVEVTNVSAVAAGQSLVMITSLSVGDAPTWQEIFSAINGRIGDMLTFAVFACERPLTREVSRHIYQHVYTGREEGQAEIDGFQLYAIDGKLAFAIAAENVDTQKVCVAACVVNSRVDGKLLVSRNTLRLNAAAQAVYNDVHNADALEEAIISYGELTEAELDPRTAESVVSEPIALEGISLSKTSATIAVGNNLALSVSYNPANASNKSVVWTSSNEAVASVNRGNVHGVAVGTATITATSNEGGFSASCSVDVQAAPPATYLYGLSATNSAGNVADWRQITTPLELSAGAQNYVFIKNENTGQIVGIVSATSANNNVCSVSNQNRLNYVADGSTTVTFVLEGGGQVILSVSCTDDSGL